MAGSGTFTSGCINPRIVTNGGPRSWRLERDVNGYRDYVIKFRVKVDTTQGPHCALYQTPGLPLPGSSWAFDQDSDQWAYCTQEAKVEPVVKEGLPNTDFDIEQRFSTKPAILCQDDTGGFDDPLLRADIISGKFVKYTEEYVEDRFGNKIINSAYEQFRGPQVEFDRNRIQVRVKQNVALLDLPTLAGLIDCVNEFPMWGFDERTVKFSGAEWEKHYHTDCTVYYTRILEFDINTKTFDRDLLDEGTKALPGHWDNSTGTYVIDLAAAVTYQADRTTGFNVITVSGGGGTKIAVGQIVQGVGIPTGTTVLSVSLPNVALSNDATSSGTDPVRFGVTADPNNPQHFVRFKDRNSENTRVILNGHGKPWDPAGATTGTDDDVAGKIHVEAYPSVDFSTLGLPGSL
jgi:hypothetical protein